MAIVKMSKFSLFAFKSKRDELLENLYKFGNAQFINVDEHNEEDKTFVKDSENIKISEIEDSLAKVKFCIDLLSNYVEEEKGIKALMKGKSTLSFDELEKCYKHIDAETIHTDLKHKENKLNSLKNEVSKLNSEVETLSLWTDLDVSFNELNSLKSCNYYIGGIAKKFKDSFLEEFNSKIPYSYVETINEVKAEFNLLILVHKEFAKEAEEIIKAFSFNRANFNFTDMPKELIKTYVNRANEIELEEIKIKEEIKSFQNELDNLKVAYDYLNCKLDRAKACENFLKTDHVVLIEGWVPSINLSDFEKVVKDTLDKDYYLELSEAENEDKEVPILLKNNKLVSSFESITQMYSLPKYNEIDPTPLLTPFYLLFFGMMMADVGYGIVMFITTALVLKFFNLDKGKRDFFRFFFYLSIPTAIFGAVYGGFFGDSIKQFKGLINPSENVIYVLIASMAIGLVQLYFGLGIKAYLLIRDKKYIDALYDVGSWYLTLTGALLLLAGGPLKLSPTVMTVSKVAMILGMISIVLTQGRGIKNWGARLGAGLYSLYGISGYVGDLVSYSRLMALGLAGGFIAQAFNLMISLMGKGIALWIFGPLLFIVGHVFNLLLSALGAYVHTCRLQYVEYFGKFYEGGGKAFKPFRAKNKYININE